MIMQIGRKYGTETIDADGNITALHGCELKVSHLPDQDRDYWQAWVNGVQNDGLSRNEAIRNAFKSCQLKAKHETETK
jgi:hypothetical protein